MLSRHEEKYILNYRQYLLLRQRAAQVLTADDHGDNGTYTITSVYYDDLEDTGLYEKLDGLALHSKFRVRTYDYDTGFVRLERKDKRGIMTKKISSVIDWQKVPSLTEPGAWELAGGATRDLMQQMQAKMNKLQEELAQTPVEATAGGGVVKVVVNGSNEVLSVEIKPEVLDPDDPEMVQDLVMAAVNEALRKAQDMVNTEMGKLTAGIKMPGGMGGLF